MNESSEEIIKPWEIGYKISNRYEIGDIKKGGMGIVYLVYDHDTNYNFAIKTFQDEYIWNNEYVNKFMEEAKTWSGFGFHPNLTNAFLVDKIEGKPLIFLEYVNLGDLSQFIGNLNILKSLDFAIQICNGMEYVHKNYGIVHRDIKPGNLLIKEDLRFKYGYCIKITDFGLVGILKEKLKEELVHVSSGKGTTPYMPPEQFSSENKRFFSFEGKVTTKSDIYSFGVTFYQLLTGRLPFDNIDDLFRKDPINPRNINQDITEDLDSILMKCIKKNPNSRYNNFFELKEDLISCYNSITGKKYDILAKEEQLSYIGLNNKGLSFLNLEEYTEAIKYFNKSLKLNPDYVEAWNNKGSAFKEIGDVQKALYCYDKALELDSSYLGAWNNKGIIAMDSKEYDNAWSYFNRALDINSELAGLWMNKGSILDLMEKRKESLNCYKKASKIDPRDPDIWYNKGMVLYFIGNYLAAEKAFNECLNINPRYHQAYNYKGLILAQKGKYPEAINFFDKTLEINENIIETWSNKGNALQLMGDYQDALNCLNKALELNSEYLSAYQNKGITLIKMNDLPEALRCYNKALEIDENSDELWIGKANTLRFMGNYQDALNCLNKALELNSRNYNALYSKFLLYTDLKKNRKSLKYLVKLIIAKYFLS